MKKSIVILFIFLIPLISCDTIVYDNPLDPASGNYVQPRTVVPKRVILNDFENDDSTNVWGFQRSAYGERGGIITDSIVISLTTDNPSNRVLQLDYDISDSLTSQVFWFEQLGSTNPQRGNFNASAMGLNSLSFLARGSLGGEEFKVTLSSSGVNTSPSVGVSVTNQFEKYTITFNALVTGGVDLTSLTSLNFTIYSGVGPTSGIIFIDEIAFEWD